MWQKEFSDDMHLIDEYKKEIKKHRKKKDSIAYLNVQLFFSLVIIVMSVMFKTGSEQVFSYVKENYDYFFETDTYRESTFSYNSFAEKIENELNVRFTQLVSVFNSRGSADIIPATVSTKRFYTDKTAVTPAQGYISSPYGIRSNPFNSKEKEFHTGIDIAAPKGTFIRAAYDGTVTASEHSSVAGNYIRIRSEDKISTLYAHNQFLLVKEGDRVMAGQIIATMGDTGRATGPHLHFEFICNGIRYNPVYVLDI